VRRHGRCGYDQEVALDNKSYLRLLVRTYGKPNTPGNWSEDERAWNEERSRQLGWDPATCPTKEAISEALDDYVRHELLEPLLTAMSPEERNIAENIPIGLVAIRTLNARALRAPDGSPLILFNQGILALVSYWWELKESMVRVLRSRGPRSSEQYLLNGYCFLLLFYRDNGLQNYPWTFEPLSENEGKNILLRSVQTELFILAHEVSHITLKHPLSSPAVMRDKLDSNQAIKKYELSHTQELEADWHGYELYLSAWVQHKWFQGEISVGDMLAPIDYFSLLALVERNPEFVSVPGKVATHPSAYDRAKVVLGRLLLIEFDEPLRSEVREAVKQHWAILQSIPNVAQHFAQLAQWVQREIDKSD
jgi:hypothetical protein